MQLTSGRVRKHGTYGQASLEVGVNLHKCSVKRDFRHTAIAGLRFEVVP